MGQLKDLKQDQWQKGSHKLKGLIILKHLHFQKKLILSKSCCHLHLTEIGNYQYDVKNAFLNKDLEEKVYIEILHGLNIAGSKYKVCWLKKALYGLKQSPRAWFERFMLNIGFHQSQGDHTLFIKHNKKGKMVSLIIYLDDIVVTKDDLLGIQVLKEKMA